MSWLLSTSLGRTIAAALALLAALLLALRAAEYRGARRQKSRDALARARATTAAHERMNHAPTLDHADDAERVDWLRDYARRNARP